ncbi:hypothetical protein FA13DRAFT_549823 [Coprinellus micaceus]|uniref:Uncharacterized protein n=1 Tax=Coprinellus micaceus TaxID=71717 RepID=A0A4Y7T8T0_COPMI|nr:hypothetical protein FA13DRAFT_549823 [Coprinellus micaceus]
MLPLTHSKILAVLMLTHGRLALVAYTLIIYTQSCIHFPCILSALAITEETACYYPRASFEPHTAVAVLSLLRKRGRREGYTFR